MKTRVNLYLEEFRPKKNPLPLPAVLIIWGISLFLISYWKLDVQLDYRKQEREGQRVQQTFRDLKSQLTDLQAMQAGRKQDPELLKELKKLNREKATKSALYIELRDQESLKTSGFAGLMLDLAEYNDRELWLTHIQIDEAIVMLEGEMSSSRALPRWVSSLKNSEYFVGREFADYQIFRSNNDELSFKLSTDFKVEDVITPDQQQETGLEVLSNIAGQIR